MKKSSKALNRAALRPKIDRARLFVAVAAISCFAASVQPASATCQTTGGRYFLPGATRYQAQWRVNKNEPCSILVRGAPGLGSSPNSDVENVAISQRPSHGVVGANNSISDHGYAYVPASDFVGKDHFQVTLDNHDNRSGDTVKMTIDVDVEVVDTISPH